MPYVWLRFKTCIALTNGYKHYLQALLLRVHVSLQGRSIFGQIKTFRAINPKVVKLDKRVDIHCFQAKCSLILKGH